MCSRGFGFNAQEKMLLLDETRLGIEVTGEH